MKIIPRYMRLTTTAILGSQRLASREMQVSFALQTGDRYKIIIGMDVLSKYKARVQDQGGQVNLKLTQRKVIWRSKQLKEFFDYIRKGRQIVKGEKALFLPLYSLVVSLTSAALAGTQRGEHEAMQRYKESH